MSVEMFFQMSSGKDSEMKETRIIHSHTKNYVLCVLSSLVSFPEECVGEGGVSIDDGMRGLGNEVHDAKQGRWVGDSMREY